MSTDAFTPCGHMILGAPKILGAVTFANAATSKIKVDTASYDISALTATTNFSIGMWIKCPDPSGQMRLASTRAAAANGWWSIRLESNSLKFYTMDNDGNLAFKEGSGVMAAYAGVWVRMLCTVTRGGNVVFYVAGTQTTSGDISAATASLDGGQHFDLGTFEKADNKRYVGDIGPTTIWTRALSAAEAGADARTDPRAPIGFPALHWMTASGTTLHETIVGSAANGALTVATVKGDGFNKEFHD